jgi:hypothetical protein
MLQYNDLNPFCILNQTLLCFPLIQSHLICTYSQTPIYVLNWSKMVVLIVKSTQIKIWISIDLHVKWINWSMTFPKKLLKFLKPLDLHV